MTYLDDYKVKLQSRRNTLTATQDEYLRNFHRDPSYKREPMILPNGLVDIYEFHTLPKNKVAAYPGKKLVPGSIFEMRNMVWLIYDVKPTDDIVTIGKIEEVNYQLKWAFDGQVETTAVYITDNMNKGVEDEDFISVGAQRLVMFIPKNQKTETLERVDRLMVKSVPYKIEKIDSFSFNGAYKVILLEDAVRQADSGEVADFHKEILPDPVNGIIGSSTIVRGREEEYILEIDGEEMIALWTLEPIDDEVDLEVELETAAITVGANIRNVGKEFTLTAEHEGIEYTKELTVVALF